MTYSGNLRCPHLDSFLFPKTQSTLTTPTHMSNTRKHYYLRISSCFFSSCFFISCFFSSCFFSSCFFSSELLVIYYLKVHAIII